MFFEMPHRVFRFKYRIDSVSLLVSIAQDLAEQEIEFAFCAEADGNMLYTMMSLELNVFPNCMPEKVVPLTLGPAC
jgi:hypothetical protein